MTGLTNASGCMYSGFTSNFCYTLSDMPYFRRLQDWARMYQEYRVSRISHKWYAPRIARAAVQGVADGSGGTTLGAPNYWSASRENMYPNNARGGDMAWFCTKRTGPIVELLATTNDLNDGTALDKTAYSYLKRNPSLARRTVFRNDVAYGMRPVTFSFRPSIPVPDTKRNLASLQLKSTGSTGSGQVGFLTDPSATWVVQPPGGQTMSWRYAPMPWLPTRMTPTLTATGAASSTSNEVFRSSEGNTTDVFLVDQNRTNMWYTMPMFGMCHCMQMQTAVQWPRNLRTIYSMVVEFRKPRVHDFTSASGDVSAAHFREWGRLPNQYMGLNP